MIKKLTVERKRHKSGNRVGHEDCTVCAANVYGRVTVALDHLKKGKIAKGKAELKLLLPLVQP